MTNRHDSIDIETKAKRKRRSARSSKASRTTEGSSAPEVCPTCGARRNLAGHGFTERDADALRLELAKRILKLRREGECTEPVRCRNGACRRAKQCAKTNMDQGRRPQTLSE